MTDPTLTIEGLVDRIEKEAPSRELDLLVMRWVENIGGPSENALHYTTSIDAAKTLVPEGWNWMVGERNQGKYRAYVNNNQPAFVGFGAAPNPKNIWHEVVAPTPAAALAAAAIRARIGEK